MGTDTGELLIVEGTELKATLQLDPGSTVHSIAARAKANEWPFVCLNEQITAARLLSVLKHMLTLAGIQLKAMLQLS